MNYQSLFLYLIAGFIIITFIDTIGAAASAKFQFKYVYLSLLSLLVYIALGFIISKYFDFKKVIMINGLLGLYDGTIGFWLSIKLNANTGLAPEKISEMRGPKTAIPMVIIAIIFGAIGFGIAQL